MTRAPIALVLLWIAAAAAAPNGPQPVKPAPAIPPPKDVAFPGTIALSIDATDTDRKIVAVHESIDVPSPGDLVLQYSKWIPGAHAPVGTIDRLAGLTVKDGKGSRIDWTRDPVDVF